MTNNWNPSRRGWLVAATAIMALGAAFLVWGLRRAEPQLTVDEDVFTTVDALFTAVTSRDPRRLDDCQTRLKQYRVDQRVPAAAARVLESVCEQARAGQWESASQRLYDFIFAQRGERET